MSTPVRNQKWSAQQAQLEGLITGNINEDGAGAVRAVSVSAMRHGERPPPLAAGGARSAS